MVTWPSVSTSENEISIEWKRPYEDSNFAVDIVSYQYKLDIALKQAMQDVGFDVSSIGDIDWSTYSRGERWEKGCWIIDNMYMTTEYRSLVLSATVNSNDSSFLPTKIDFNLGERQKRK